MIRTESLAKVYPRGSGAVHALRGVDLDIERGEFVAITGRSGSGKSTLMHLLGCLDRPSAGRYCLDGVDVSRLGDRALSALRAARIGFVFQTFHLLPESNVIENVALPFLYGARPEGRPRRACEAALDRVGLLHRLDHRPAELSGGEMQRVAIARALVTGPDLILADEPTGNLDQATGREIMELFQSLGDAGATLVLVTHDTDVAALAGRECRMLDGLLDPPTGARS